MRRIACLVALLAAMLPMAPLAAREVVEASAPRTLAVTVYRDPARGQSEAMDIRFPQGFAMISETREVRLPAGESTILFGGVAEGMVAVSAIVTGLPGGTIEKNRNADLLSPAALVDGTLGNRVRITRFNPGSGASVTEQAIVRTRADGGLVLQTAQGFEAVRCSGLPEKLTFQELPRGLSAQPVFSIDTVDPRGGTYTITLTYLAWGFDWQAHYVGTLDEQGADGAVKLRLLSWLTLLNDNGQSFESAELMAVAGKLSVVSDYESLAEPPAARPLRLTCFPIGSTAAGSPVPYYGRDQYDSIVVTGMRLQRAVPAPYAPPSPPAPPAVMEAAEEQLGDLKLYRVPEPITVNAKELKQVAFLNRDGVEGTLRYAISCYFGSGTPLFAQERWPLGPTAMTLETKNDEEHGLGVALPTGRITLFEPSPHGDLLLSEQSLRDYAQGQDIEIELGSSDLVRAACGSEQVALAGSPAGVARDWRTVGVRIGNARGRAVTVRVYAAPEAYYEVRRSGKRLNIKNGMYFMDIEVAAGSSTEVRWEMRNRG